MRALKSEDSSLFVLIPFSKMSRGCNASPPVSTGLPRNGKGKALMIQNPLQS